jgi:hypothetical protein
MSYKDDEEFSGAEVDIDTEADAEELLVDEALDDPLLEDDLVTDDDLLNIDEDEELEEFAGLDGSNADY